MVPVSTISKYRDKSSLHYCSQKCFSYCQLSITNRALISTPWLDGPCDISRLANVLLQTFYSSEHTAIKNEHLFYNVRLVDVIVVILSKVIFAKLTPKMVTTKDYNDDGDDDDGGGSGGGDDNDTDNKDDVEEEEDTSRGHNQDRRGDRDDEKDEGMRKSGTLYGVAPNDKNNDIQNNSTLSPKTQEAKISQV